MIRQLRCHGLGVVAAVLGLQGTGCHPYMKDCELWEYDELMSTCGYDPADPTSGYLMGGTDTTVDLACVEAISQHYCMDWNSFDEQPKAFNHPSTVGQNVVASLLTIAGTSAGPLTPEQLSYAPSGVQPFASRFPEGAGLGEVMFEITTQSIETIRYNNNEYWDSLGSYRDGIVQVGTGDDIDWVDGPCNGCEGARTNVGVISLVLVHEAAHSFYPHHHGCPGHPDDQTCDPTIDGAYGLSTWWAMTWMEATLNDIYGGACHRMIVKTMEFGCDRIGDHGDWPFCDDNLDGYYIDCHDAWW